MDIINDLYKMCETLGESLKAANEKVRAAGGKLTPSDMQYVDQLTHAIKSIKATIAMIEAEEGGESYEGGGSYRGESYARGGRGGRGGSYRGGSYDGGSYDGESYDGGSYEGDSYARGRGRNARRDSQGRYSREGYSRGGYSRDDGMVEQLQTLMQDAPDQQTRQELQKLIQKMQQQ